MLATSPRISAMIIVESDFCHSCREEIYGLLVDEAALYFPHIVLKPPILPHLPLHATMFERGCEEDCKARGRLGKSPNQSPCMRRLYFVEAKLESRLLKINRFHDWRAIRTSNTKEQHTHFRIAAASMRLQHQKTRPSSDTT
jgi:hypothetical protein